jgi:glycosyltransferase involved in cell wall biosynthesis
VRSSSAMVVGHHYFVLVACDCAGDIWKKIAEADRKLCLAQAPISAMYNGISYTCICKLMAFLSRRRIRTLRQNFLATPSISVLIDTYNQERFIEKAIESVLEQDFTTSEREIIVVDDGSTDRTPQIVRRFEPRLRYIRKENGGQASAFNVGIPECRGQIIAFLDGDDYWLPGKLSRVAEVFATNPPVGFVGHAIKESLPDGQERISAPTREEKFRIQSVDSAQLFRLSKSFLGTSRMAMRAEIARSVLRFPKLWCLGLTNIFSHWPQR